MVTNVLIRKEVAIMARRSTKTTAEAEEAVKAEEARKEAGGKGGSYCGGAHKSFG